MQLIEAVHSLDLMLCQSDDLIEKIFRPYLKFDAVLPVLFLGSSQACLALNDEFYFSIQFFRSHMRPLGERKGRDQYIETAMTKRERRSLPRERFPQLALRGADDR
jgi:hypothetical protein